MLKNNCQTDFAEENGQLIVSLRGEIDHHSAVSARTRIDAEIAALRPQRTVLDLKGIDFMDSSGLGLIMGRYARMQAIGGTLVLRNPDERIMRILKLAGLDCKLEFERREN